ncbi:MAG: HDOD domain-containing protein [Gammaproteobacteria bacterium]|nr:HDOD domain-containing protein [Gammaproteobacteria bacterium]
MDDLTQPDLISEIMACLENTGDLPIFSASVNRVQLVGSDPNSDAMALAVEMLKDANLTTKLLKLANSSYYNRGAVKIGALSRAVVLLGFETVKSTVLTMKLLDSFQFDHPGVDLGARLVSSYMSAGFVKEMAAECGIKDIEQTYICGLLHNLGEIIVGYTMPEAYLEMKNRVLNHKSSWVDAQRKVVGMTFQYIGQQIVERWEFPDAVSKTMTTFAQKKTKGPIKDKVELNRSLVSLTHQMMDLLYSDSPTTTLTFFEIRRQLASVTGVNTDAINHCLDKSFKQSYELAGEYGIDKTKLLPKQNQDLNDETRNKVANQLIAYISTDVQGQGIEDVEYHDDDGYDEEPEDISGEAHGLIASLGGHNVNSRDSNCNANTMLTVLHELTEMISKKAHINSVFKKVLDGMHCGVGFDRAMLALLSPDHKSYTGRMVVGKGADALMSFFIQSKVNINDDLFSSLIIKGGDMLVADATKEDWCNLLPDRFVEKLSSQSFLVASVRVNDKPVGLFYADKFKTKTKITRENQRGFMQLVAQVQLALQLR